MADAAQDLDAGAMDIIALLAAAIWQGIIPSNSNGKVEEYWCHEWEGTGNLLHSHPESVPHECTRGSYEALLASRWRHGVPLVPVVEFAYDPSNDMANTFQWGARSFKRPSQLSDRLREGMKQAICRKGSPHAVVCLLPLLRRIFAIMDPFASVQWLFVILQPRVRFQFDEAPEHGDDTLHAIIRVTLGSGAQWVIDPCGPWYGGEQYRATEWAQYQEEWIAKDCQLYGPSWTDSVDEGFLSQQYDEDQIVAKTLQGYNNWVATLEEGEAWFHNIHVDSFVVEDWRRAATNLHRAVRDAFA